MNILEKIVKNKKNELEERKKKLPEHKLLDLLGSFEKRYSLKDSIVSGQKSGIIAEFKRKSPSKGIINALADPVSVALAYEKARVSGLSVLTDSSYFGGSTDDLKQVRAMTGLPILRKDFIIDHYQIIESKYMGASAVLLIASILKKSEVEELSCQALLYGMEVLVEIHDEAELYKLPNNIDMIGINNRNLRDFQVDIKKSAALINKLPSDGLKIAESGISTPGDIHLLRKAGFDGFLIGTLFMKNDDPGKSCLEFSNKIKG